MYACIILPTTDGSAYSFCSDPNIDRPAKESFPEAYVRKTLTSSQSRLSQVRLVQ